MGAATLSPASSIKRKRRTKAELDSLKESMLEIIADGIEAHAAKEGLTTSEPTADTGIIVLGPSGEVLTRAGEEREYRVWVPLREVAEALGYTVDPQHLADQGKVYIKQA